MELLESTWAVIGKIGVAGGVAYTVIRGWLTSTRIKHAAKEWNDVRLKIKAARADKKWTQKEVEEILSEVHEAMTASLPLIARWWTRKKNHAIRPA